MALHMVDSSGGDMFLMKIEHGGQLQAHAIGTLSDVVSRIADQEYAAQAGEESEVIEVWHLSYGCPMQVATAMRFHREIDFVEVIFGWDQVDPRTGGVTQRRESGYFRIPEA